MDGVDFERLFEASPDVLLVLLPDAPRYTMVAATRSRLEATGTTRAQIVGQGLFDLFPDNPDDPAAAGTANLRASLARVLATREPDTMAVQKYDIRGPDGSFQVKYWSPKNLPVMSASGEILYILHRVEDVTELVRADEVGEALRDRTRAMEREVLSRSRELAAANQGLREANARLGELDAAKTSFFSNVSHELRTPLTLMLGPLDDALAAEKVPEQRARLVLAHDNALRLLKLVNTLLDFSRFEAGRLQPSFVPVELATATVAVAEMFRSAVDKAGLELSVDCRPLSGPVWVDPDLWEKVVTNLVSNAFKYTHEGSISLRMHEDPDAVVLEVADTGVGIPETDLGRIFERFHRVAGTVGRTHEGTGIGLALVRELVELHAGRIDVNSTVGRGTTFRVVLRKGLAHLPAAAVSQQPPQASLGRVAALHAAEAQRWVAPPAPTAAAPAPVARASAGSDAARRGHVLVVDDSADLRTYISGLLAPHHDVSLAADGLAGLEMARTQHPDIVLSDVMMPRLDGFGLLRELRSCPDTRSLPVILLSARAGEEASIEGLDAGADDYLVKPFSARELLARVRTHIELARKRRAWVDELERANRELDAFSYSVAHDLRSPLRSIDGFSRVLAEDYGPALDETGHDYLARIASNAQRMAALIDGLLEMARVARAPVVRDVVDLSELATAIVADLRHGSPERQVTVDIPAGLVARGDRRLLGIVMLNLLGNAWKFSRRRADAHIEVGLRPGAEPTFYVRDNGAGFDMAYASRLFGAFQRLHEAHEFEGTGIGLATVQRVIARHGGRIWAESAVGRGAAFYFTLPA